MTFRPLRFSTALTFLYCATCGAADYEKFSAAVSLLAERDGNPWCRASYLLPRQPEDGAMSRRICFPRELWSALLREPLHAPPAPAGAWIGTWKTRAWRRNPVPGERQEQREKEIVFTVRSRGGPQPETQENIPPLWLKQLLRRVEMVRERLSNALEPSDPLGVCRHLLLNERSGGTGQLLRIHGFVHLLTATGIHLYALSGLAETITRWIARAAGAPVRTGVWMARAFAALSWIVAWLLAGMRPGMLRPVAVVVMRTSSRALGFRWRKWSPLMLALLLDLSVALIRETAGLPGAWAPGRWVYALAVGGGLAMMDNGASGWRAHFRLAIGSWITVALFEVWAEGFVALGTPILSVLTIPLFCTVLFPALLLGLFIPQILGAVGAFTSQLITSSFELLQSFPSIWVLPRPALLLGVGIAGILLLHTKGKGFHRGISLFFITAGVLAAIVRLTCPSIASWRAVDQIEQLDVGQGDAALIRSGHLAALIDTGPPGSQGAGFWFRILSRRQITRLEFVALTHLDEDHAGGIRQLARLLPIGCVVASAPEWDSERGRKLARLLRESGIPTAVYGQSSCFPFPSVTLISPFERRNSAMTAMRIPLRGGGFYLNPGDSGAPAEETLAQVWGTAFKANSPTRILKVGHHGSKNSTAPKLLSAVRPTEAWISVGLGNRFRHPAPPTTQILEQREIPIRRTDREGRIAWP